MLQDVACLVWFCYDGTLYDAALKLEVEMCCCPEQHKVVFKKIVWSIYVHSYICMFDYMHTNLFIIVGIFMQIQVNVCLIKSLLSITVPTTKQICIKMYI